MTAVLGISCHYHDAAAALVVDGVPVAAIQEERLSRMKNDPSLPIRAARACLGLGGVDAGALDAVLFYENPYEKLDRVMTELLRAFPRSWRLFPRALASQVGGKLWVLDQIADALSVPRRRVGFVGHHESHAASAFYASPFHDAAVLVVDGVGEVDATSLWRASEQGIGRLESIPFPHSLGLFYAGLTAYLGFRVNEGEYKLMGLAAHGTPRFHDALSKVLRLAADGSYALEPAYFAHMLDAELGFGPALEKLLGPRRPPGHPWDLSTAEDQRFADVAASAQVLTEEALVALARRLRDRTGAANLCLAGGVALNALANARILREAGFDRVFVQPAAGDAGGALGAAYLGARNLSGERPRGLRGADLGEAPDPARAMAIARQLGLSAELARDGHTRAADLIARGEVVALVSGRFEWGPRALGQRSLLAGAGDPAIRRRLNGRIKQRETFRPFAPALSGEHAPLYFHDAPNDMTPFMTTVCRAREDRTEELSAVTHADGTARVQTVAVGASPALSGVLAELEARHGQRVVLNTSQNGPGEPIVASEVDAIGLFYRTEVDALLVEDVWITRPDDER